MRRILSAMLFLPLALALAAGAAALPQLPRGELPNSEVVTNVALGVDFGRLERLSFLLSLDASESNSLSIAVGAAAGENLALEEADFEWGYDCGRWFYADTATGSVEEWPESGTGRVERVLTIARRDFNTLWNRLRVVKRGLGDMSADVVQTNEFMKFSIRMR